MKGLWRNRVFLLIVGSDILQNLAIWVRNMALLFLVMEKTNSDPIAVSLLTVMEYAPIFIFSFIGGALADRWNPKRTMIAGDLLSALSICIILLFLELGYWEALFAAILVSAIVSQFSQPSSSKVFKRHVEEQYVSSAIAITQSMQSLFLIIGPVVGTFLYTKLGLHASLYSLIVIFIVSAVLLMFLPTWEQIQDHANSSFIQDIKEGWGYVFQHCDLFLLTIVFCIVGLAAGLVQPLEVFLVTERLGLEKEGVQYLSTAAGIGLLGGGVVAIAAQKLSPKVVLVGGLVFLAIASVVEVMSTLFWLTATMRFMTGMFLASVNIVVGTFMIKLVPENMVGRINGTITPLFMGTLLLGSAMAGSLMEATSLITVFAISALLVACAIVPALRMKMKITKASEETTAI
ncbi:MFS transporter [Microbacteriaceae bacterium 4G12]